MVCNKLNRFFIPLESTCCLFVAYCHEFLNRESYDGFVVPIERTLKISYLTYHSLEGASRICLIYQIVHYHKDEDSGEYVQMNFEALNQTLQLGAPAQM